ncbi:DNAH1 [Symbiodinium microadriaticum]|nr:DNAH1 [Symbiodinium microadriaticum]
MRDLAESVRSQHVSTGDSESLPAAKQPTTAVVPPKVIKVHHHRPGDIPRKVTVAQGSVRERQQKKFGGMDIEAWVQGSLEDLLLARGISFHKSRWDEGQWLSLNDFDNTEYDIRTPEQWIDMGKQADGLALPVLATGLRLGPDRTGSWQACVAIGHDGWGNSFDSQLVRWLDMNGEVEEESEPVRRAQSRAQLNFFIDNMCLDADQVSRASGLAEGLEAAANALVKEANLDFARTPRWQRFRLRMRVSEERMNKIIFINNEVQKEEGHNAVRLARVVAAHMQGSLVGDVRGDGGCGDGAAADGDDDDPDRAASEGPALFGFVSAEELEDDESPFDRPVPMYSLWPVPEYSFTDLFSAFCPLSQTIYNLKYTEALRLDYFTQLQKTVITSTSERVKEKWAKRACWTVDKVQLVQAGISERSLRKHGRAWPPTMKRGPLMHTNLLTFGLVSWFNALSRENLRQVNKLQKIMLQHFTNVGKGWFSIHETNPDTYRQGKMRKLLSVIRFVMQDTLRYFALDSVGHYCEGLERQDLLHVESTFDPPDPEADKAAPRLFHKAACSYMEAQKHLRAHTGASHSIVCRVLGIVLPSSTMLEGGI